MEETIVNKVSASPLATLDLESYYPAEAIMVFDLKGFLFRELIIKEKEFREALQAFDWSSFQGKIAAVTCSADAIIPVWAYMLIASYLQPVAIDIILGDEKTAFKEVFLKNIAAIDLREFQDKRVVVKGCGDRPVGEFAFLEITKRLRPLARSIMYGEPCSTVPVFKKK